MTTIHDIVLGPAIPDRACGDCVACCQVLDIDEPELVKPADQMCEHCSGEGCSIHESRPQLCRDWDCVWRRIVSMPLETRPDHLGVLWTIDRQAHPRTTFDRLYVVARAVDEPEALKTGPNTDIAAMMAHGPLPIFAAWGDQRRLIYPRAELAEAILQPTRTHAPGLAAEGREFMDKFEPFARLAEESLRQAGR
jgi:hypothetical protein